MKYASLKFSTHNIGDEIQNIAAEQFLPYVTKKFDRDQLNLVKEKDKYLTILNGWYMHNPENWPPSKSIIPIFIGFHITDTNESIKFLLNKKSIDYLKRNEPIGCRDRRTTDILLDKGIDAYYSKCLSLTFSKRITDPLEKKILFVDTPLSPFPEEIRKNAEFITHYAPRILGNELKTSIARKLLNVYKEEASLIITSRLHCALPCIAYGIPVMFFGNRDDYRVSIIEDLGAKIHEFDIGNGYGLTIKNLKEINWSPKPLQIEDEKEKIIHTIQDLIQIKLDNAM